jgi:hypothetical protein
MIACAHTVCALGEKFYFCAAHPAAAEHREWSGCCRQSIFLFFDAHIHNKFVRSDENERMPAQAFPGGVIEKVTTESCVKKHMRSPHTPGQL